MKGKIFIFTELIEAKHNCNFFEQRFNGVCCGQKLKRIKLSLVDNMNDLVIGHYIFKIEVDKIVAETLYGRVISFKYFSE